jgi:hypothetical protein
MCGVKSHHPSAVRPRTTCYRADLAGRRPYAWAMTPTWHAIDSFCQTASDETNMQTTAIITAERDRMPTLSPALP